MFTVETIDREYGSLLRGICRKYFNNDLCEDAYQETLIKAHLNSEQFDGANLRSWVCRIACNCCIDMIRKTNRHKHDTLDKAHNVDNAKMSDIERNEINAIISKCIDHLTPRQEIICKMRLIGGMSLQEIALEIDVTTGTVKTLLHRGIAIMRVELEKQGYR